jgi:hypothetical protein
VAYESLLRKEDQDGLLAWLDATGELFVHLGFPRMHGTGDWWLVASLSQLDALLSQVVWPELELSVFRQRQLPVRGVVTPDLIEAAVATVADGTWYAIRELTGPGPHFCRFLSDGNSCAELADDLDRLSGRTVAVGPHPEESGLRVRGAQAQPGNQDVFSLSLSINRSGDRSWPRPDDAPASASPGWAAYVGGQQPFLEQE